MEKWKDVIGYEGLYQVSDLGRIKALSKIVVCGNYNSARVFNEKILKPNLAQGYYQIALCSHGIRKQFKIHRLVALHFITNHKNKKEVNHINGIKTDNRLENLEWCTSSENTLHAYKNGLQVARKGNRSHFFGLKGELSPRVKIVLNKDTGIFYYGVKEAAEAHGINHGSLKCYLNGVRLNKTNLSYV